MKILMVVIAILGLAACGGEGRPIGSSSSPSASSEGSGGNDLISNAQTIQLGSTVRGRVGPTDIQDYYEFSVQQGKVITINLVGNVNDDIDLFLYREGSLLETSASSSGIEEIIYTVPVSGNLQVGVKYYAGSASDYSLTVISN